MNHDHAPPDSAFDLRTRAELSLAFEPSDAPAHLFCRTRLLARRGLQRSIVATLLIGFGLGGVLARRPPELVRGAIEHEYFERTLRGALMVPQPLLRHLGPGQSKVVPGFAPLMRPCDIDGHLVYHLTTFFEKGGRVTPCSLSTSPSAGPSAAAGGATSSGRS